MNRRWSNPIDGLPLTMLHPTQFEVNEAWLAFKLNESPIAVRRLFEEAKAHRPELPQTLIIPSGAFDRILATEAERQGIAVVRVPEDQLLVFIGEARASFKQHFGGGSVQ